MEPLKLTEAEKRDMIAHDPRNMFVEAGAGAGKTHEMMNRIVNRIAQGTPADQIVVITFTNAATEEMYSRLSRLLREKSSASDSSYSPEEQTRLQHGLQQLDSMTISTIHSFCFTLLQEYSLEAGLPLNLEILEDDQDRKDEFFYHWLNLHFSSDEIGTLIQAWEAFTEVTKNQAEEAGKDSPKDAVNWQEALKAAYQSIVQENGICQLIDPLQFSFSNNVQQKKAEAVYQTYTLARQIAEDYQKLIQQDLGQLSHDQILLETEQLLRNHPEIRNELKEEYREFFVDEFQDTDPVQIRIIWLLAMKELYGEPAVIHQKDNVLQFPLRDGSLFIVGDPKQSIYRFRGAQVEEFNRVREVFRNPDHQTSVYLELSRNYRSSSPIIQAVNQTYQTIFAGTSLEYHPMKPGKKSQTAGALRGESSFPVQGVWTFDSQVPGNNAEEICSIITTVMQKHPDLHYSDFLIITPDSTSHEKYIHALQQWHIPALVKGNHSLSDPITQRFLLLLEYFASPDSLYGNTVPDQSVPVSLPVSRDELWQAKKSMQNQSPEAVVHWLLEQKQYYYPAFESTDSRQAEQAKIHLTQLVEQVLAEQPGNLYKIYQALNKLVSQKQKLQLPMQTQEDTVRLMNVHQVKGLEGNIVILGDKARDTSNKDTSYADTLRQWPYFYPSFQVNHKRYCSYSLQESLLVQGQQQEDEENRRLEYVALTRARYAVIFTSQVGTSWFSEELYPESLLPRADRVIASQYNDQTLARNAKKSKPESLSQFAYSYFTPSGCEKKSVVTGLTQDDPHYVEEIRPKGNIFGICFHRGMELLINRREEWFTGTEKEKAELVEFIARESVLESSEDIDEADLQPYYDYLCDQLQKMMIYLTEQKDIFNLRSQKPCDVYTEYPFTMSVPKGKLKKVTDAIHAERSSVNWVTGTTDLLINYPNGQTTKEKKEKYCIYDYKTDTRNGQPTAEFDQALLSKYQPQLDLYQVSLDQMVNFGIKDSKAKAKITDELLHLYEE